MFGKRARLRSIGNPIPFRPLLTLSLVTVPKQFRPGIRPYSHEDMFHIVFIEPDGKRKNVRAYHGNTVLDVALENEIDIEGTCQGTCACSTCHVIVSSELFDELEEPSEDEVDMLGMALGLTDTSRLGCQITLNKKLNGAHFQLPSF